ncbi:MAG: CpaF family protein [Adlercreutzia sp.]|uniref:CpaF family protein n=1 Tax=uncultured Adlercreutzia sp. TaxID=875803 RepID=UPI00216DA74E|nr:CpaF family protein [uncultured Adlercreutzia sp.]MCI8424178.1 CpaF family protein [Adlercreutzia sp.]
MSLLERVQVVEGQRRDEDEEQQRIGIELLRAAVGEFLPLDRVALIMAENPERARNEIRAACRRLALRDPWRALDPTVYRDLVEDLISSVFGLGPLEDLIADESITEIMVNGARSVFVERDGRLMPAPVRFESDEQVRALIDRILGPLGRRVDESMPMASARLPQGHRVNAILPPVAIDGPHVTIRSFARRVMSLAELQERGSFDGAVRQFLVWAVRARRSMAVAGGTGSGKTTLLNALSLHIASDERIITIEDAAELKFDEHPHVVRLEARAANAEGAGEVTIRDLVVNALRMRPDRIIVGECRAAEALDMLQAMNTGHDGSLTTLHANSPYEAVDRLVTMVRYAVDLPLDAIEAQIGNAFDLVVQTTRRADGSRCISELASVGFDRERRRCSITPLYRREGADEQGVWLDCPSWVDEVARAGLASEKEVRQWKQHLPMRPSA